MRAWHGTSEANAERIRREGFSLAMPRRSDPGDFGWGVYLTRRRGRAKAIGGVTLLTVVRLRNPLHFPTMKAAYDWMEDTCHALGFSGGTLHDKDRVGACKALAAYALARGWDGLVIDHPFRGTFQKAYEVVVYDPSRIEVLKKEVTT